MKTKAFSDTRFTLGHRDYSERNTQKEDITVTQISLLF